MRLIDRYIGSSVVSSILVVTSILLALFTFMGFFEELDDIGRGQYDTHQALLYILLGIPSLVYQLMPMATLLGCIIGLGMLANNSELVVIRSAGVSLTRIAWSVIKIGIIVVVALVAIGEWVAPNVAIGTAILVMTGVSVGVSVADKPATLLISFLKPNTITAAITPRSSAMMIPDHHKCRRVRFISRNSVRLTATCPARFFGVVNKPSITPSVMMRLSKRLNRI